MVVAKVKSDLQIDFPQEIKDWLRSQTELAVFLLGNTLILKKVLPPKLSEIAERKPAEEMPLAEIVEEVHQYRKEKRENL